MKRLHPLARPNPTTRALTAATIVVAVVGLSTATASAHVTIENDEQPAGAFAILHFQVPNETAAASTTKVEIALPDDVVIPFALPRTVGDWVPTVTTRTLDEPVAGEDGEVSEVVASIAWEGGTIAPGQFELFDIELGPLPDTPGETLAFPAVQTYDDGDVVRWIDPVVEGQEEPEHPAPTVTIVTADADALAAEEPAAVGDDDENDGDDGAPTALVIVALVLGVIGTALGATALVTGRRRA